MTYRSIANCWPGQRKLSIIQLIYCSFICVDIKNNIYSWNSNKSINFKGNHVHWWRNGKNKTNDLLLKLVFIFYILHIALYIIMYYGHTYVPKGMERESTTRKIQWVAMVQASSGKKNARVIRHQSNRILTSSTKHISSSPVYTPTKERQSQAGPGIEQL